MNPEVKRAWIEALTSGKYEQANGTLRRDDSYCVLGVLCDVYRIQKEAGCWENHSQYPGGTYNFQPFCDHEFEYDEHLPTQVSDWAGLDDEVAVIPEEEIPEAMKIVLDEFGEPWDDEENDERLNDLSMIRLNDAGVQFPTLAKIIERVF